MNQQVQEPVSTMTVTLVTFGKDGKPRKFDLSRETTIVGRKTDANLRIPLADISRTHCELALENGHVTVRDLDSSNGTFVNGEQVDESKLKAGDELRLGPIVFFVQVDGEPADIKPPAPKASEKKADEKPAAQKAAAEQQTVASAPAKVDDDDDLDIDDLDDLDIDDLSDLDLDDELDIDDELEEIDDLEEVDEDEVVD